MSALNELVRHPAIEDLADRLMNLNLAEAAALRVHLEEVHGIRPSLSTLPVKEEATPPVPPEPTHFAVVLEGLADPLKKMSVFKAVREITKLGLKETRELIEGAPATMQTNLLRDEAVALQKKLEDAGARITLVPVRSE